MKKFTIWSLALMCTSSLAFAQSAYDAFEFSNIHRQSTARGIATGGALGSIGGDASSIAVNPAGIGVYRSSELAITPTIQLPNASSTYFGDSYKDGSSRFVLGNASYISTIRARGSDYNSSSLKALSFGLTYNRVADFNDQSGFTGLNNVSSFTDIMSEDAKYYGIEPNIQPPLGFFGYEGFLLYDDNESIPRATILNNGGSLRQTGFTKTTGGVNDFALTIGGNIDETILFGVSASLINYSHDRSHKFQEEDATGNTNNDFDHLIYSEIRTTYGSGFNMKLGATFIPNEAFRIGVAFHTPTWSSFEENASYNLLTHTENLKRDTGQPNASPLTNVAPDYPYEFHYNLRTPWRAIVSAGAIIGKKGYITADYEYVDYTSMKYSGHGSNLTYFNNINAVIKDFYQGVHQVRVGAELRLNSISLRAGGGYSSNPFREDVIYNGEQIHYSGGLGYRTGRFGLDLAYMMTQRKPVEFGYPILASGIDVGLVDYKKNNSIVALTLSYRMGR